MAARFIWTLASVLLAAGPTIAAGTVDLEFPPVDAPAPPPAPSEVTRSFWANPRSRTAPLDVSFHRLDVVSALRFLTGEQTNVVAADDALDQPVTMSLRSVNPGEALDHLLSSLDLGARVEGNTVFLEKSESRTFRIPLVLQAESRVWEELQQGVSSLAGDNALVALNQSGGVLTVADRPSALDRLEDHLDRVVISLLQQIEIEVEILEASYQVDQGAGVDWTLFNGILDPDLGVSGALSGAFATSTPTDPREVFQVGLVKADKWRTVLDAFEDDVRVDLVSRPRMTVMSNQPALFALRERIPYLQKTVSQEGGVTRTDFEIVFDEAGVELSVVASVTEGGEIQMEVHPRISAVTGFTPILPDLGSQPVIDLRETKSLVRLAEGQATVLSGMLQDRERKNATGIPVLMHVPVLGRLFRHETTSSEKTEIIIVLTPRFRKEPAVRSLERYDSIAEAAVDAGEDGPTIELAASRARRARERLVGGDLTGAVALARASQRVRPSSWWTLNNLGLAQRQLGLLGEAEQSLRQATRASSPPAPVALLNYGTLLLHRGRADEAAESLERAASLAPPGDVRREARLAWALAAELAGRPREALEILEAVDPTGDAAGRIEARRARLHAELASATTE